MGIIETLMAKVDSMERALVASTKRERIQAQINRDIHNRLVKLEGGSATVAPKTEAPTKARVLTNYKRKVGLQHVVINDKVFSGYSYAEAAKRTPAKNGAKLCSDLRDRAVLNFTGGKNMPHEDYIHRGLFIKKAHQAYVTPAGLSFIQKLYATNQLG